MKLNFKIQKTSILVLMILILINCQTSNENYYGKVGDLNLRYTIKGKGPIMIVGHLSSGKIGYERTLAPLEKHFTVVYYEPRGTGKSEIPQSLNRYSQDSIVQEIEDLRKKLAVDKIWIFGHSDQSAIALIYALKFPQNTSGLILSGTSWVGTQAQSIDRRKEFEIERSQQSPWFAQVLSDWDHIIDQNATISIDGRNISDAPIKWWCYDERTAQKVIPIVNEINQVGRRKPINGIHFVESEFERQKYLDYQSRFSQINTKILIVNGKFDTNNPPKYAKILHQSLPNSKLQLIEKAGHFPWIENPTQTFEVINHWMDSIR